MNTTVERDYLTCAETAKLIRGQLKRRFPGVKFSVKSSIYSGGSSVSIHWTDGPPERAVDAITAPYASRGFDGSIDLGYCCNSWLLPDGSMQHGRSSGTEGSRGQDPAYSYPKPHPDARLVTSGAGYVHTTRHYSTDVYRAALERVAKRFGLPMPTLATYGNSEPYIVADATIDREWFDRTGDYPGANVWKELRDHEL